MKNRISHFVLLFACLICLFLCVAVSASADSTTAIWPQQTTVTNSGGSLLVDASGAPNGYFFAAISYNTSHRLKLRVIKDGTTFTYDLKTDASYELFPLQLGTGYYEIHLYENISGKKYAMAGSIGLYVTMENQEAAFLVPNQYINYTRASEAVAKADELCAGKGEKDAYDSVCKFMTSSFVYDFIKAVTIKPSMLPDIDGSYAKKMGICQDLAAITCAMLRTQGIPARMIIGYADNQYHAWTTAKVNGKDIFFDPTAAIAAISTVKEYSMERYY